MKQLLTTRTFLKHYKKRVSPQDDVIFKKLVNSLLKEEKLPSKFKDHKLSGNLKKYRECHIKNDLLLIYQLHEDTLTLVDIGSHSQLFK